MKTIISLSALVVSSLIFPATSQALSAAEYLKKPKLVVVLVVDQLRGDQLNHGDFLPAGTPAKPGGFRFLTHHGAWYPSGEYDILQSMTCPGHAMILSGSRPARNGITTNDWFDVQTRKSTYCATDAEHGVSPRRLQSTTVGDELKNGRPKSRVIAVAAKDRSAIMLGGHRADLAIWLENRKARWTTSTYYNNSNLPDWVKAINARFEKDPSLATFDILRLDDALKATEMTFELATKALVREKLGKGSDPDLLAVSLSAHDAIGHKFGPESKERLAITRAEDRRLARFFADIRKHMGSLDDVVFVLTADHGIPPSVDVAKSYRLEAGQIDSLGLFKRINEHLDRKFGAAGKEPWVLGTMFMHYHLNHELIAAKKIKAADVEAEIKPILLAEPGVHTVFTRSEFDRGVFPAGLLGQQVRNTYRPGQSGDLIIIPKPFHFQKTSMTTNHMTGWSYDRNVPILFVGRHFKPGVYAGGLVVDIAPTLSFSLGILPPSMSEGRVLSEALR